MAHSSRIREPELLERIHVTGTILTEATMRSDDEQAVPPHVLARAIANARAALAHFMRGESLQSSAFPGQEELLKLLGEGDGTKDALGPLKTWLLKHPEPEFHPRPVEWAPERRRLAP